MAKLVLADITNLENETTVVSTINANSALIEAALEKTLTRDDNTSNPNEDKKILYIQTPKNVPEKANMLKKFYLLNGNVTLVAYE